MALDLVIAAFAFAYGMGSIMFEGMLPYAWVMSALGMGDFYLRLWRRNVRQARFFDDHFEISGYGVNLRGDYDKIKDLTNYKQPIGDFRSDIRVSFSVHGNSNVFLLPNRRNRRLGLDVYSLLQRKTRISADNAAQKKPP